MGLSCPLVPFIFHLLGMRHISVHMEHPKSGSRLLGIDLI